MHMCNREIFEPWGFGDSLEAAGRQTLAALANRDDSRNLQVSHRYCVTFIHPWVNERVMSVHIAMAGC